MSITGSGTQADPYIVHSYSEIKSTFILNSALINNWTYLKLANDINCNDYGADFEWETITTADQTRWMDFDLDGHTIKNFKVGYQNYVFNSPNNCKIHNGKILNVFLNGAYGFDTTKIGLTSNMPAGQFEDISMSINATGASTYIFANSSFKNCAVYIESTKLTEKIFVNGINNQRFMQSSDFKLNIENLNSITILDIPSGYSRTGMNAYQCRFTGKCKGKRSRYGTLSGSPSLIDCVVSIDFTESTDSDGGMYAQNLVDNSNGSGVCNHTYFPSEYITGGLTKVTSSEIISGDSLRAKGFAVVNVVGD